MKDDRKGPGPVRIGVLKRRDPRQEFSGELPTRRTTQPSGVVPKLERVADPAARSPRPVLASGSAPAPPVRRLPPPAPAATRGVRAPPPPARIAPPPPPPAGPSKPRTFGASSRVPTNPFGEISDDSLIMFVERNLTAAAGEAARAAADAANAANAANAASPVSLASGANVAAAVPVPPVATARAEPYDEILPLDDAEILLAAGVRGPTRARLIGLALVGFGLGIAAVVLTTERREHASGPQPAAQEPVALSIASPAPAAVAAPPVAALPALVLAATAPPASVVAATEPAPPASAPPAAPVALATAIAPGAATLQDEPPAVLEAAGTPTPAPARASPEPTDAPAPLEGNRCTAKITSQPRGAVVSLEGQLLGKTPLPKARVPCRPVELLLTSPRYSGAIARVAATPTSSPAVFVQLARPSAELRVTTVPAEVSVKINGVRIGSSRRSVLVRRYERVRVEATLAGYQRWKQEIYIRDPVATVTAVLLPRGASAAVAAPQP